MAIAKVSRSGYYKWETTRQKRKIASQKDQLLKEKIMEIHHLRPFFGYPRMLVALRKAGFLVNHKRVYRLMKELHIQSAIR
ncbi:IS3 family transposase, partial [Shimazuella kribbensis]|uniref:IS3 family transposase n=1 Tax=Shimazuella kribbensis TaxID=139808 RepID=UPI001471682B